MQVFRPIFFFLVATIFLFLVFHSSNASAVQDFSFESQQNFAQNRIVVKFSNKVLKPVEAVFSSQKNFEQTFGADAKSLDALFDEFGVLEVKPIFREPKSTETSVNELKKIEKQKFEELKKRFPKRALRAPKNVEQPELFHVYVLTISKQEKVEEAVLAFSTNPFVQYAQPDYAIKAFDVFPNQKQFLVDPFYNSSMSWGQDFDDLWGIKKIDASFAWANDFEGQDVVVAVIDSGLDYMHEDIASNVFVNSGEDLDKDNVVDESEFNGVDDDLDGFVDNLRGWDFFYNDNDPKDFFGHGTHVAGIIAAQKNNGVGVVGVAPKAKILIVKGLSDAGFSYSYILAAALSYAIYSGADIINNSWGCTDVCPTVPLFEDLVESAYANGVAVVFAAGNSSMDAALFSPQNMPQTITVGATDHLDNVSDFSNHGFVVDIVAPGGESGESSCNDDFAPSILSLRANTTDLLGNACGKPFFGHFVINENYYRLRGTSMSAPHVSGAIAVLLSKNPLFSVEQIRGILRTSAKDIAEEGLDSVSGAGRLDLKSAVENFGAIELNIFSPSANDYLSTNSGAISITGVASGIAFRKYSIYYKKDDLSQEWFPIVTDITTPAENGLLASWNIPSIEDGKYLLKLLVNDKFEEIVPIYIGAEYPLTFTDAWEWLPKIWDASVVFLDAGYGNLIQPGLSVLDLSTGEKQVLRNEKTYAPDIFEDKIVWQDISSGDWDIYLYDLSTQQETQLTTSKLNQSEPKIFENFVAFTETSSLLRDVYLYDLSSGQTTAVSKTPFDEYAADVFENNLLWVSIENGNSVLHLYNISSGVDQVLLTGESLKSDSEMHENIVVWKDDRHKVGSSSNYEIYLYDILTQTEQRVTSEDHSQHSPTVYSNKVFWSDQRLSSSESLSTDVIFSYDILTGEEEQITFLTSPITDLTLFENKLIWADYRLGNFEIFAKDT